MIEQILANFFSVAGLLAVLGFFVKRWMDDVKDDVKALCETVKEKVSNKEFDDYKGVMRELRDSRDKEILHIKDRVNHHGHDVDCESDQCNAKAGKVVLT